MKAQYFELTGELKDFPQVDYNYTPLAYAFKNDEYYICLFASNCQFRKFSNLALIEKIDNDNKNHVSVNKWIGFRFDQKSTKSTLFEVGKMVRYVWRPTIHWGSEYLPFDLEYSEQDRHSAQQRIRILLEKLDDLLLYIEPAHATMHVHGHKIRELLILASTEAENYLRDYLKLFNCPHKQGNNGEVKDWSMPDYCKLNKVLDYKYFQFCLRINESLDDFIPFEKWGTTKNWYSSYNTTKHNSMSGLSEATIANAINAIAACLSLYSIRYDPSTLEDSKNHFSALYNQLFYGCICDEKIHTSVYIPHFEMPVDYRDDFHLAPIGIGSLVVPYGFEKIDMDLS